MRKNLKKNGLVLFSLVLFSVSIDGAAEIYKWTDKNGKVHFGDAPPSKDKATRLNEKDLAGRISSVKTVSVKLAPINIGINRQTNMLTMFTTSRCPYCQKARRYFAENDIEYIERNVEKSAEAKAEYKRLGGKGVPLFLAGRYQMQGFSEGGFKRFYSKIFPSKAK